MLSSATIRVALNAIEEWKIPATDADMQAVLVAKHELRGAHAEAVAAQEKAAEVHEAAAIPPSPGPARSRAVKRAAPTARTGAGERKG